MKILDLVFNEMVGQQPPGNVWTAKQSKVRQSK